MRKLQLDLDTLDVQSFATDDAQEEPGTVQAYSGSATCADSCDGVCGSYFCASDEPYTCEFSCIWTCTCNPYDNC